MYSSQSLFLYKMGKLKKAIETPSEENLFDAAAILRLVLLDSLPLFVQANKGLQHRIRFVIQPMNIPTAPPMAEAGAPADGGMRLAFSIAGDAFSPDIMKANNSTTVKLDAFLASPVAFIVGHIVTVKDVILYLANIAGGVHKGTPDNPKTKAIEEMSQVMELMGVPSILISMRSIIAITIAGLDPIYQDLLLQEAAEKRNRQDQ